MGFCNKRAKDNGMSAEDEVETSVSLRDRHPIEANSVRFEGEERLKLSMDSMEKKMLNEMLGNKVENICVNGMGGHIGINVPNRKSFHQVSGSIMSDAMYENLKEKEDDMLHTMETDNGELKMLVEEGSLPNTLTDKGTPA